MNQLQELLISGRCNRPTGQFWYGPDGTRKTGSAVSSKTLFLDLERGSDQYDCERIHIATHHYAHLGNCTLDFAADGSGFKIEPFSSTHRCRNRSPINFDEKATCPEFETRILSHVSADDRLLLQKYAGQCLLGRNLVQRFVVLDGVGSASKSAFVLTIAGVVGLKNVYELRTAHLHERFEIGRMIDRTLLIGSDVQGGFLSAPGAYRIKSLVGGDPLEAEKKGSNHRFTIKGRFNLMITANTRLCIISTAMKLPGNDAWLSFVTTLLSPGSASSILINTYSVERRQGFLTGV